MTSSLMILPQLYKVVLSRHNLIVDPCIPMWNETANTNVVGGAVNNASSLAACQTACVRNTSCSGVDCNPGLPTGQMCWLAGKDISVLNLVFTDF